jgi:hypothetical protein
VTELVRTLESLFRSYTARTVVLRVIDMVGTSERRSALQYLLDDGVTLPSGAKATEEAEPLAPITGLPQKLRGAIHELTRLYPHNLVVDAAMLEMPEEHRREVARAFLPREERKQEVRRFVLVDSETGDELWEGDEPFTPQRFDYVAADGSVKGYQREGFMAYELGPGADVIIGRSYYRSLESLAEEEAKETETKRRTIREKIGLPESKPETKRFTWVVGSSRGAVLGTADEAPEFVRVIENGQQVSYTRKRVVPEYDFREDENAPTVRQLAVYTKDGGQ